MAHLQITDTAPKTIAGNTGGIPKMLISVGSGFTGTITTTDANGPVGIVTNPTTGNSFQYWDLVNPVVVACSVAGNVTVSSSGSANK